MSLWASGLWCRHSADRMARKPGVSVTVVTDAVRAIDEDGRTALLNDWEHRGVALVRTAEVVA